MLIIGASGKNTKFFNLANFFPYFLYNNRKKDGKTKRSNGMATIKPPITAMASGCCICAPMPNPRASGVRASIAPMAVINLGRMRRDIA